MASCVCTFQPLAQRLSISVPGCPQPVLRQYIRDAAIDACERTLAWRYEQPPIRLTPGVYDYPYEQPKDSEVHAFLSAAVNGQPVTPLTLEALHQQYPDWRNPATGHRGTPRYLAHLDSDTFGVAPQPDDAAVYDLSMIVALKPLRSATCMDQTAMDNLEDVIIHGALRDLLILPDKNWSDRELAVYHAKQYVFKVSERRARATLGAGRASLSVQMRPFA
jgi:hypothetical protein